VIQQCPASDLFVYEQNSDQLLYPAKLEVIRAKKSKKKKKKAKKVEVASSDSEEAGPNVFVSRNIDLPEGASISDLDRYILHKWRLSISFDEDMAFLSLAAGAIQMTRTIRTRLWGILFLMTS